MTTTISSGTMRYAVEAQVVGPGVSRVRIKGSAIDFDTAADGGATLPGPADLLVTAFAACVLKNVARLAERLPFRYRGAAIHVTAEREGSRHDWASLADPHAGRPVPRARRGDAMRTELRVLVRENGLVLVSEKR